MGIDQERFVEVNPELVCCICASVLEDPIESPCRHVFCTECITKWLDVRNTCPTCREPLRNFQMKPVLPILRNIIGKLRIGCDYIAYGCTQIVDFEQLGRHCQACPYGPATCENEGCEVTLRRHEKDQHKPVCPYREVVCSTFSSHGCGMAYKANEVANHNCVQSLKSYVKDLEGKVVTLEQTVNELKQGMQELQSVHSHALGTLDTRNSSSMGRTGLQDGDSGLISLLSEDEEDAVVTPPNDNPTWTSRGPTEALMSCIANDSGPLGRSMARRLPSVLGDISYRDRELRPSRASRRSSPTRRDRSRSPIGLNSVRTEDIESSHTVNGSRRRQSRMSASRTCTQTSSSASGSSSSNSQHSSDSPVAHPRRRRRRCVRQINVEDGSSSQIEINENDSSSSEESEQRSAAEASDRITTSPHGSPARRYSSSDDSYFHLDNSDEWWRELAGAYSSNVSFSSDGSTITAHFH